MTEVFNKIEALDERLSELRKQHKTIGFVPTMGALHKGHISLIERSNRENDTSVCSVFVNPIQFNNQNDLLKYPHTPESDIEMLSNEGCDIIFIPSREQMYPESLKLENYHFGTLETVMEGKFRPGHFNGVAVVVKRFFDIVQPNKAYFGLKDFQQLAIIKDLVRQIGSKIEIVECGIIREVDGLAMSSRNSRLSAIQRKVAPYIYEVLLAVKEKAGEMSIEELKAWTLEQINREDLMKIEYFEIVSPISLMPVNEQNKHLGSVACIALYMDEIRLIDNIILFL